MRKIIDKTVSFAFWIAVASSAVIFFAMYANWLVAGFQLHRRPVPMHDDPGVIGGIATAMYSISYPLSEFAGWTLVLATGLLILTCVWPQQFDRRNAIRKLCISIGITLLVVAMFIWDPWQVANWYFD